MHMHPCVLSKLRHVKAIQPLILAGCRQSRILSGKCGCDILHICCDYAAEQRIILWGSCCSFPLKV